jgi:hypothetical protein
MEDPEEPLEEETKKAITLRPLTKYEQNMMLRARTKHKENITKDQKCWGKTFQGSAFIPKPDKIVFKDFDVGSSYSITVVLTNVSFTFNSFKLLPLELEIKDFFAVTFTPPGRMSAGLTCPVTITFNPKVNKDIVTVFPILSETGEIQISLECYTKKSVISYDTQEVNFKEVILGEHGKKTLTIKNDGALGSDFKILDSDGNPIPVKTDKSAVDESLSVAADDSPGLPDDSFFAMLDFPRASTIGSYSSQTLNFKFSPSQIGEFTETLQILYSNSDIPRLMLKVTGHCIDVPICVERDLYDFQVCILNHTYRERILLRNRSLLPMKVQLTFPKDAKDHLEFNPTLGFIQAKSEFEIWVKFKPNPDVFIKLRDFVESQGVFRVPIKVTGANQVMPVNFEIRAEVSDDMIEVDPPLIDFGEIWVQTAVSAGFKLRSRCQLPQEFAFVRLPPTVSILPAEGFGVLLPGESLDLRAVYRPAPVKPGTELTKDVNDLYIRFKSGDLCGREIKVPFSAKLQTSPIIFSCYKVEFPVTPINEISEFSLSVTNVSKKVPYSMEISPPGFKVSGLGITPVVIPRLSPGVTSRIIVKYSAEFREPGENLGALGGECQDFEQETLERSQHYKWLVPVYFRSLSNEEKVKKIFIEIRTCVTHKHLIAEPDFLDFGEVAVACRKIIEFVVKNNDFSSASLMKEPLSPYGGFAVLNAMRVVEPGQSRVIVVEFEPLSQQLFEEKLTLKTATSKVSVALKGRGVRPQLKLEPEDGLVNMGNTVVGDTIEKTVMLKNLVTFPFEYSLKKRAKGVQNFNGLVNFTYIPQEAKIEPGKDLQVKIRFNPDHYSERYFEHVLIDVPNQIDPKEMFVAGNCWKRSVYVRYDKAFKWPSPSEMEEESEGPLSFLAKTSDKPTRFELVFIKNVPGLSQEQVEQTKQRKIVFGNCKLNDSKSDKAGAFEINMPKVENNLFVCDVAKGNLAPGAEQKVTFTFNPLPVDPLLNELEVLRGIGQWIEVLVEGKITGGWVPPGMTDQQPFEVLLRAYVQQI